MSNTRGKNLKPLGHDERVELYAERFAECRDIYTGETLRGEDLESWSYDNMKRQILFDSRALDRFRK